MVAIFDFVLDLVQTAAIGYFVWRTMTQGVPPYPLGERRAGAGRWRMQQYMQRRAEKRKEAGK